MECARGLLDGSVKWIEVCYCDTRWTKSGRTGKTTSILTTWGPLFIETL